VVVVFFFFFFNDTATTEIYTLSLHDALPICLSKLSGSTERKISLPAASPTQHDLRLPQGTPLGEPVGSVTDSTTRTLEYARREH